MIFRFKNVRLNLGENDLAGSIVAINRFNAELQKVSADGRKRKQMRDIATQIMLECEVIREVTSQPLPKIEPGSSHPLARVKPGLLSRWLGIK